MQANGTAAPKDSGQADLMKYFNDSDLFELFEFNYTDPRKCDTMSMLLKRDGFPVAKTPTVDKHITFLRQLQGQQKITGLSLNSNLYSKGQEESEVDDKSYRRPIYMPTK